MAKEAQKQAELEAKREEMKKSMAEMTPEERANEKLRMRKIQEEADLRIAVDMMGLNDKGELYFKHICRYWEWFIICVW